MATTSPVVTLVHATDAPQHLAELKTILQRLRSEKRIADFTAADASQQFPSALTNTNNLDGIIVMLTHDLQRIRPDIEKLLRDRHASQINAKCIEIIVDNVPYNNDFITFPDDLLPIRSREDMEAVWRGIERDLALMFPRQLAPPPLPTPRKKGLDYLRLAGTVVATFFLSLALLAAFQEVFRDNVNPYTYPVDYYRPYHFKYYDAEYLSLIFFHLFLTTMIPIAIFFMKPLWTEKMSSGEGSPDWKRFLKRTSYGLSVFFVSLFFFFFIFVNNMLSPGAAVLLPPLITVLLLFRKYYNATSDENAANANNLQTGSKGKSLVLKYLTVGVVALVILFVAWQLLVAIMNELNS